MSKRKVRILELARAGKWGLDGSEITRQDIAELAETFAGKRPVIIGHDTTDRAPKFGDALDCWPSADGLALAGPVIFSEAGDALYEAGHYDGWSVSMPRRASDNKRVLHHLAILGAVPPKIPGLAELERVTVDFGEGAVQNRFQFSGKIPEKEDNESMSEEEKKALAGKDAKIAELEEKNKALAEQVAAKEAADSKTPAGETPPGGEAKPEPGADAPGNQQFADMQKKLDSFRAERRRERLEGFAQSLDGKIPAGIAGKAKALAGRVEGLEPFDFSEGGKTEQRDALWLLADILRHWPEPVKTGASGFNYGDGDGGGEKPVDWQAAAKKM